MSDAEKTDAPTGEPTEPALPPDIAACRAQAERAVAVLTEILSDASSGTDNRLRAAIRILAHARPAIRPLADGLEEEPRLEGWLQRLGPREPATPDAFEERAKALRL